MKMHKEFNFIENLVDGRAVSPATMVEQHYNGLGATSLVNEYMPRYMSAPSYAKVVRVVSYVSSVSAEPTIGETISTAADAGRRTPGREAFENTAMGEVG